MNRPLFGVAGYPNNFLSSPDFTNRENIFTWLHKLNLDVFELEWTYGINMSDQRCERFKRLSTINNITVTLKGPKNINLFSNNEKVYLQSLNDLDRAYTLAKKLDINRLVISLGNKQNVNESDIKKLSEVFKKYDDILIYIEINKRRNNFGSIDDIMLINKYAKNVLVYFNLANLHIREGFSLVNEATIQTLFKKYKKKYKNIFDNSYFNVYPIYYTLKKDVEVKSFGDTKIGQLSLFESNEEYYPKAGDYIRSILKLNINPIIVSKSFESEELGAIILRDKHFLEEIKEKV